MYKVFLQSLGCPMRSLEATRIKNYIKKNGYEISYTPETADYIIIVTCVVIKNLEEQSWQLINQYTSFNGKLIVLGCLPETIPNFESKFKGIFIGLENLNKLDSVFPDFKIKFDEIPLAYNFDESVCNRRYEEKQDNLLQKFFMKSKIFESFIKVSGFEKEKKIFIQNLKPGENSNHCFLVIASGCNNNCSYCNIRDAIGNLKSKDQTDLVTEYKLLLESGHRIITIIAEDLGSYGLDNNSNLPELFNIFAEADKSYNVRWVIDGINPKWAIKYQNELIPLIQNKKIWEFTIPVESGSDRILSLMNRHYCIIDLKKVIHAFRYANNAIKLNAIFIIGFPSETEDDFKKTLDLLNEIKFDDVTLIGYSEFENRASAKIQPKVSKEKIEERIREAHKVLKKINTANIR